jgi:hypothetical protein
MAEKKQLVVYAAAYETVESARLASRLSNKDSTRRLPRALKS